MVTRTDEIFEDESMVRRDLQGRDIVVGVLKNLVACRLQAVEMMDVHFKRLISTLQGGGCHSDSRTLLFPSAGLYPS